MFFWEMIRSSFIVQGEQYPYSIDPSKMKVAYDGCLMSGTEFRVEQY
jgi:hypothetical protein